MRRALPLLLLAVFASAPAGAQPIGVALGDAEGPGMGRSALVEMQRALKKLPDVEIRTTSAFKDEAARQGVARSIPLDAQALANVAGRVDAQAVVYLRLQKQAGAKRAAKDRELLLTVFSGVDGRLVGERIVTVPRGKLTRKVWDDAALTIEPDLREAARSAPPPPPPPPVVERAPVILDEPTPVDVMEERPSGDRPPFLVLHVGPAFLARTFDYTAANDSPAFADGIHYESALVPGFSIDAEAYPLAPFVEGAVAGLGLGLRYEKVFVSTEQVVDGATRSLDTSHQHFLARLLYRYAFGTPGESPEVGGHVGFGMLDFVLEDAADYRGATYRYLDVGIGGYVPLGTPLIALEAAASVLPFVSLGDSVEELGDEASVFGYRLYGGLGSVFGGGFSARGGVELTSLDSEVSGAGRGGRKGDTASDSYLGVRLTAGYRF